MFGASVHIKVTFILYCHLLSVQQQYVWKKMYAPSFKNNAVGKLALIGLLDEGLPQP